MTKPAFKTPYGIVVNTVTLTQWPRVATIAFEHGENLYELRFTDPRPFSDATLALDECYQILIVDQNSQTQKEFGRYIIEIHGEDGLAGNFTADLYEHIVIA